MGFFKDFFGRSSRVVKGQVNKAMDSMENATFESTLRQSVKDMKTELARVVKASAEAMSNTNRLEAEYERYQRQSEEWQGRAKKALNAGNEELARKALVKKNEADAQVESLKPAVDKARETSGMLKEQVLNLKRKISEAERMAGTLIARKNAARAQKKVSQALAGVADGDNAFAAIQGMEEKVAREEAAAKAYESLSLDENDELAKEFEALDESSGSIDADLDALKKEVESGKQKG